MTDDPLSAAQNVVAGAESFDLVAGLEADGPAPTGLHRITLDGDGITWRNLDKPDDVTVRRPYAEVVSVMLGTVTLADPDVRHGACFMEFQDGTKLVVVSYTMRDAAEERLTRAYGRFVDALHARLANAGGGVRFLVGPTPESEGEQSRVYWIGIGIVAVLLAFVAILRLPWWAYGIAVLAGGAIPKLMAPSAPLEEYDPKAIPPALRIG